MNRIRALSKAIDEGRVIELPPSDKAEALRLLSACLANTPAIPNGFGLLEGVLRREAQSLTYLRYGVASPHARAGHQTGELACAIGWSPSGIEYGNSDGWSVHLLFMYYVPASAQHEYLAELSKLARAIEADKAKHELVNLDDLEGVIERLRRWSDGEQEEEDASRQAPVSVLSECTPSTML